MATDVAIGRSLGVRAERARRGRAGLLEHADRWSEELGARPEVIRRWAPIASALAAWIADRDPTPRLVGVAGGQGTGKSTLSGLTARLLEVAFGRRSVAISIDDVYLTRAERDGLARSVHPLLQTRGVPGTHDLDLLSSILDALRTAARVRLPRFDKLADDRAPQEQWLAVDGPVDVVLLEGWCVGARSQPEAALAMPVNDLERNEDPHGTWRAFVNQQLAGPYRRLFARLDAWIFLAAPSFGAVRAWRGEQERSLARTDGERRAMTGAELDRFVQHFERTTLNLLGDAASRADIVVHLDTEHEVTHVTRAGTSC